MSKNVLIFIGTIKETANCGESIKNNFLIRRFNEVFDRVLTFNTWGVKRELWRIIKLISYLIFNPKAKIIVSASTYISYDVIRFLKVLGKKNVYYWVIGGIFPEIAVSKHYELSYYKSLKGIFVEGRRMVETLMKMGINNAKYIPNFKRIDYQPSLENKNNDVIKFVFLSRIHPDKGCSLIIESVKYLNDIGYHDKFQVDFYGPIDPIYFDFLDSIKGIENVDYKGFLKLDNNGYDRLAQYNMMLFPTFWKGEGFPGIVVDAFISGLPILATDWNFIPDLIDNSTGIVIPHNNQYELNEAMKKILDGQIDLNILSKNCYDKSRLYDDRNVLSVECLKELNLL